MIPIEPLRKRAEALHLYGLLAHWPELTDAAWDHGRAATRIDCLDKIARRDDKWLKLPALDRERTIK
jgi:hypothetical protein